MPSLAETRPPSAGRSIWNGEPSDRDRTLGPDFGVHESISQRRPDPSETARSDMLKTMGLKSEVVFPGVG